MARLIIIKQSKQPKPLKYRACKQSNKMKTRIYLKAKYQLKQAASEAKKAFKKDNPAVRQAINDELDSLIRIINSHVLHEEISEKASTQIVNWLTSYACRLHL